MKKELPEYNPLCSTCRKRCKQPKTAVIASCPSYAPLPKELRTPWKQMELKLTVRK